MPPLANGTCDQFSQDEGNGTGRAHAVTRNSQSADIGSC